MIDITHKTHTLRSATAQAIVLVSKPETILAIERGMVPKGDVFSMSKAAGLLGVKKTPELLPDCHPLPIEYTGIDFEINGLEITVRCTIKTIYKTGVEVEAMHGVSVVALNMYDMLKPIDKGVEIRHIKLLKKQGGKSDYSDTFNKVLSAAVIVCSDSISEGKKEDYAGKAVMAKLESCGVLVKDYQIIPDEKELIQEKAKHYHQEGIDLIIFSGGTGLSHRDVTPEALLPLLERRIPELKRPSVVTVRIALRIPCFREVWRVPWARAFYWPYRVQLKEPRNPWMHYFQHCCIFSGFFKEQNTIHEQGSKHTH